MNMNDTNLFNPTLLNPNAAKSLDETAVRLLKMGTTRPFRSRPTDPFPTRRETETITDLDIVGEIRMEYTDWTGRTLARYFSQDGHEIGLFDEGYVALRRLVEQTLKTKPFNRGFSPEFMEKSIFAWFTVNYGVSTPASLSDHVMAQAIEAYGEHHLVIPISAIEIESPFQIGNVLVAPMDKQMLVEVGQSVAEKHPEHAATIEKKFSALVRELSHLTGVHVKIWGEAQMAKTEAIQTAFRISEMFRFMSAAAVSWNVAYPCFPYGCYSPRTTTSLTVANGKISELNEGILEYGMLSLKMTFAELDRDMKSGFANFAVFFRNGVLTPFEVRVGKAISAFTAGVATHDVNNRLIYVMSSLEHLFLRNEQEPIQNGVGERIAFFIEKDAKKRRGILANFKKSYTLRSKQIHHLSTVDDEDTLSEFSKNAWIAVFKAMESMPYYRTHTEFLDAIDNVKFGGG
jgi:hypothetical protein